MEWNKLSKGNSIALIIFYFIGYQIVFSILPYFVTPILVSLGLPENIGLEFTTLFFQLISLFIAIFICKDILKKDWKPFKDEWKSILRSVLLLYILMYVINTLLGIGLNQIGSKSVNQEQLQELLKQIPIAYNFMAIIVAPIIEELVFRLAIFRNLYDKNKFLAYFISSLLFGLLHVIMSVFTANWIDSLYIVIYISMSIFMAKAYEKHKTIYASILYHIINNSIAIILLEIFKYVSA